MNGSHGQTVQQHVVKEFKQGPERVCMMLKTSAIHSLRKKVAVLRPPIGSRGPIVQQHVIVASKQKQEYVLTIQELPSMSRKRNKKLARFETVV